MSDDETPSEVSDDDRQGRAAALRRVKAVVVHYLDGSGHGELLTTDLDELDAMIAEADVRRLPK